jgi:hypothetical protein
MTGPGRFTPGNKQIPIAQDAAWSVQVRIIRPPPGFVPWAVQPVASRYSEYTEIKWSSRDVFLQRFVNPDGQNLRIKGMWHAKYLGLMLRNRNSVTLPPVAISPVCKLQEESIRAKKGNQASVCPQCKTWTGVCRRRYLKSLEVSATASVICHETYNQRSEETRCVTVPLAVCLSIQPC